MSEVGTPEQIKTISEEQPAAAPARTRRGLYSLQSLAGTIVIAVFVITFVVQAFQIPSESMEKTLLIGDYLLVDKAHYGHSRWWSWLLPYRPIRRQDIIVFRYPVNPRQHFVKRVVAVPGDHVRLVNKHVYVNGLRQDDDYATFNWAWRDRFRDNFPDGGFYGDRISAKWFLQAQRLMDDGELIVPEGSYFVLGDNRDDSYDSRYWGFVPQENVVGRPLLIYWSMDRTETAMASEQRSDKLSNLTVSVTQVLSGLRWHRMLRIPQ
ncbi:MAG: signal peptidase I [Candidatus Korobacteraceae bacterium]|jgi:signal peptidase I